MERLDNVVQSYAWGSNEAIAALQGRAVPSPGPEAELWLGAHPLASSRVRGEHGTRRLTEHIADAPDATLGARSLAAFGPTLPFLLKVLAAERPLSLQAHPDLAQAREGFAREEAAGIPRDAAVRSYRDANHKPELICALTPFDALCGFRAPRELLALFDALDVAALAYAREALSRSPDARGLREVFTGLFTLGEPERCALVSAVVTACASLANGPFGDDAAWTLRFAALYPGDIGVVVALMLRRVRLSPG
ncbi:MAG: mannose-6-phosphate isomerase, class I, partial [Deltaproteobacteria bacterium]